MQVINNELLKSVAGGMGGGADTDGVSDMFSNLYAVDTTMFMPTVCSSASYAADISQVYAANTAAEAASAQLVANAAPSVAGSIENVLPSTFANCAAGISALGVVGKLSGAAALAGKAVNLMACSVGAIGGVLKNR